MRKAFMILGLVAGLTMTANDAFAQRWGGGRGGSRGGISFGIGSGGIGFGYGNYGPGGYGGYYGGNRGYYPGGYGGYYGNSYYPNTYGWSGGNYRYSSPYNYSQPYYGTPYYSSPNYYYQDSAVVPAESSRQSFYPEAKNANVTVIVPHADAEVWFNSQATTQRGTQRYFQTPPLEFGNYTYTVRARWMDNGQPVEQQRQVQVQGGQDVTVDFRNSNQ
jgi:uncharacterized protein (TIGR03000 family)